MRPSFGRVARAARSTSVAGGWFIQVGKYPTRRPLMLAFESKSRRLGTLERSRICPGDGLKNQQGVFDRARHGAEFVERPAEGHGAGARNAAVSGAKSGDAATHAGADDATPGFAADR